MVIITLFFHLTINFSYTVAIFLDRRSRYLPNLNLHKTPADFYPHRSLYHQGCVVQYIYLHIGNSSTHQYIILMIHFIQKLQKILYRLTTHKHLMHYLHNETNALILHRLYR